jgi:hypothetical protein
MPPLDRRAAVARANGHAHELAAAAFSFSAANDEAPDAIASKVRANGLAAIGRRQPSSFALANMAGIASFKLWQFAGSLLLGGLSCFQLERLDDSESD